MLTTIVKVLYYKPPVGPKLYNWFLLCESTQGRCKKFYSTGPSENEDYPSESRTGLPYNGKLLAFLSNIRLGEEAEWP